MTFDCGKETNTRGKPTDDCQNTPTSHLIRSQHPSALMTSAPCIWITCICLIWHIYKGLFWHMTCFLTQSVHLSVLTASAPCIWIAGISLIYISPWLIYKGLFWHVTRLSWHFRRTRAPWQHQRLLGYVHTLHLKHSHRSHLAYDTSLLTHSTHPSTFTASAPSRVGTMHLQHVNRYLLTYDTSLLTC